MAATFMAAPALSPWLMPQRLQTVGRCRRCVSPSWMSSWTSEKLWMSSMGDGGGEGLLHRAAHRLGAEETERWADRLAAVGLDRVAGLVGPSHVVAEHAEERRILVERAAQSGVHRGAVAG